MLNEIDFRMATLDDANAISQLILNLADFFLVKPRDEQTEPFLATMNEDSIAKLIATPSFSYWVAFDRSGIKGVIALRDHSHVYHFFVSEAYQRQGIARELWKRAKGHAMLQGGSSRFTVNSSLFAVPVYEALLFQKEGGAVEKNGIAFVPMKHEIPPLNQPPSEQ
ncbi:GNAT family N-acetyltransferase [Pseudomonas sp. CVAP|uniref:GNAT family N-acetyltransferase n=1 Tax=Pseudomonas sp. CVAP\|nr:GNAT family N-acetyltransferase [Pseudomonas sp. CVAP\